MTDSRHSSKDIMESKVLSSLKVSPLQLLSTPIFQRIGESKFSTVVKVRRGRFLRLKKVIFRVFLDEINFGQTVDFRLQHVIFRKLRVQMVYLRAILVNPIRRQNFAGKLYLNFYKI